MLTIYLMYLYFQSGWYWRTSLCVRGRSVRGVIFIMMALVLCYVMSDCLTLSYVLFYRDYGKLLDTYFLQELRFLVFFVFLCGLMMSLQTLVESIKNLQWMFKRSSPSAPLLPKSSCMRQESSTMSNRYFWNTSSATQRGYKRTWLLFQRVCEVAYTLYMSYHVGGSPKYTNIFLP